MSTTLAAIHADLRETRDNVHRTLSLLTDRGTKLEALVEASHELSLESKRFEQTLDRHWRTRTKVALALCCVALIVLAGCWPAASPTNANSIAR